MMPKSPPNPVQQNIADQLLSGNFTKAGPALTQLTDPLVDTPMVVTLDQLKPYDLNPRLVRNPLFEEIKASIRERGLDAPPAITRRPGETHYIIRNGGNTRLSILNELWKETKDQRFFKIHCLFRPWQNEIVALTGHLAENELHGQLTFIERAIAVGKLGEMYEGELKVKLNQRQLAQKLSAEGYPISETQISRMSEAVNYLLPIIPNALYGGLSRTRIDLILRLRKNAKNAWKKYEEASVEPINLEYDDVFMDVLSGFDVVPDEIDFKRLHDELVGHLSKILGCSYNQIAFDLSEKEARQRAIENPPSETLALNETQLLTKSRPEGALTITEEKDILALPLKPVSKEPAVKVTRVQLDPETGRTLPETNQFLTEEEQQEFISAHIVSETQSTSRLDSIEEMLETFTGEEVQDFKTNVVKAIPIQAGGLYPISDLWHVGANLDNLNQLRSHIGQLVLEIADEYGIAQCIETAETGIGYVCHTDAKLLKNFEKCLLDFFVLLAQEDNPALFNGHLFIALLIGSDAEIKRLSDVAFVKLLRVLRLLRRYWEIQYAKADLI